MPRWDAIVIGGGVVGCAVLRELTVNHGWRCLLIERSKHLASGASSGNTGIACTASDVMPGTLEHTCLVDGMRLNRDVYRALNVPHHPTGSLYVGYSDADIAALAKDLAMRVERGDASCTMLSADEARSREPALDATVAGALFVPGETVVDPWLVPIAYARHAHENGATIRCSTEATAATWDGEADGSSWRLTLRSTDPSLAVAPLQVEEKTRLVVACGGLHGDALESLHRASPFRIQPRRGDFVLFDDPHRALGLKDMPVGQVPSATSRGVYVWRSVHGVVACGPTAEDVEEREMPPRSTRAAVSEALRDAAIRAVPQLRDAPLLGTYAGLRPGSDVCKDYQIERVPRKGWITVGGIRSTGLTGSLGIARYVGGLCEEALRESGTEATIMRSSASAAGDMRTTPLPPVATIVNDFRERGDGYVAFGEDEMGFGAHYVTHPLTRAGFERLASFGRCAVRVGRK